MELRTLSKVTNPFLPYPKHVQGHPISSISNMVQSSGHMSSKKCHFGAYHHHVFPNKLVICFLALGPTPDVSRPAVPACRCRTWNTFRRSHRSPLSRAWFRCPWGRTIHGKRMTQRGSTWEMHQREKKHMLSLANAGWGPIQDSLQTRNFFAIACTAGKDQFKI